MANNIELKQESARGLTNDILFEQKIVQNNALAAEALWQATQEAYEVTKRTEGVHFPLMFLVLPLTFHKRTASVLASKTQPGVLYKALGEDREIVVGLQERMQAMSQRTFEALSISFQTGLLLLDRDNQFQIFPGRKTAPVTHVTQDVKIILKAAKRLGSAFSEMSFVQLSTHLNIKF